MDLINQILVVENNVVGEETIQTINARSMHEWLEVKRDFSHWIKDQVKRARLVENRDFVTVVKKDGRQILNEYYLSIDSAKHIAMISGTEKGYQAREYFIEMEKRVKQQFSLPDFTNPAEAAIAWAEQWKERERLQLQVEKDKPLVVMAETLMEADIGIKIQEFARIQSDKTGLGRNKLYSKLREWGIFDRDNKPFQRCIDLGWFYIVEIPFRTGEFEGVNRIVYIRPKGQNYITNRLNKEE